MGPVGDGGAEVTNAKVFIEIAAVERQMFEQLAKSRPAVARSFWDWLDDPRFGARRVGAMLAANEVVTKMPWDDCRSVSGASCEDSERWDLTVTPHLTDARSTEVRMELTIVPKPPLGTPKEAWQIPEHPRAQTTIVVQDQTPIVLGLDPAISRTAQGRAWTLLVTPYIVRRDEDLRRLVECRTANANRALRELESPP
jgi:hypothetical protein